MHIQAYHRMRMDHKIPKTNFKLKLGTSTWSWGQKTAYLKTILGTIGSSTSSWISELQVEVLKSDCPRLLGTMIGYGHKSLWHYLRLRFWTPYSKRLVLWPGVVYRYSLSTVVQLRGMVLFQLANDTTWDFYWALPWIHLGGKCQYEIVRYKTRRDFYLNLRSIGVERYTQLLQELLSIMWTYSTLEL